jgi:hypothetical protein
MSKDEPNSPWWLSGTPLGAEHGKMMRRRYPAVPWDESTAATLTPAQRERAAKVWRTRSEAEYLAVSTFSILSMDLCAAGAPADILSMVHRAAIDEVRHAEFCIRLASIYSGKEELPPPGMSNLPDDPKRPKRDQALANALLVSCVAETFATIVVGTMRDEAKDPAVNAVLSIIYADEVVHARIGWSYLGYCIRNGGKAAIDAAASMVPIAVKGCANVVELPRPNDPIEPELRAHGLMTPAEERVMFCKAIREVLAPGFLALGVPVGDIVEQYDDAWAAKPPPEPAPGAKPQKEPIMEIRA